MMIHDSWVHNGDDDNVDDQTTVGVSSFSPLYTWALLSGSGTLSRMTPFDSQVKLCIFFSSNLQRSKMILNHLQKSWSRCRWITVESFLHLCQHGFHKGHCSSLAFDIGQCDPNTLHTPCTCGMWAHKTYTCRGFEPIYCGTKKPIDSIYFSCFWGSFVNHWTSILVQHLPSGRAKLQGTVFPRSGRCDSLMRDGGSCDEACGQNPT